MITNATAAAAVNHWCADSIPLARPGSDRSRNTLSVQFAQQFGSKNGSRTSTSTSAASAASR
jgi:hypothetical protein